MKRQFLNTFLLLFCLYQTGLAQPFDLLDLLKSEPAQIYFSTGNEKRASGIKTHINAAYSHFAKLLDFKPDVTLLVLNPADWKKFASPQAVYGMPHFNAEKKTLFVAAEDNQFWKSFLPPLDRLSPGIAANVKAVYQNEEGNVSMQKFFDLLAIHELGHSFHLQKKLNMQRNWMSELFVNILLHTYIAEKQPQLLSALTLFPTMVVAGGSSEFIFTGLKDMHEKYQEIATKHPKNYGWYQCRLHAGAAEIYNAAGKNIGKNLWESLQSIEDVKTDNELALILETTVHKSVADLIRNWDIRTK